LHDQQPEIEPVFGAACQRQKKMRISLENCPEDLEELLDLHDTIQAIDVLGHIFVEGFCDAVFAFLGCGQPFRPCDDKVSDQLCSTNIDLLSGEEKYKKNYIL
jgi:hypothetical protein